MHPGLLIPAYEINKSTSPFSDKVYGEVVDNDDPLQLSRVKCNIPERAEEIWVYKKQASSGGSNEHGSLDIPRIGDRVSIENDQNDPYHYTYSNLIVTDGTTKPSGVKELYLNYPNAVGSIDAEGNGFIEDRETNTTTIKKSGIVIVIKDGSLSIDGEDITMNGKDINLSGDNVTIKANNITLDASVIRFKGQILNN